VTLSQIIAFLSFQIRVSAGLRILAHRLTEEPSIMPDEIVDPPLHTAPAGFTRALLDWQRWLEPLTEESLTERQMAGLVDAVRAKSPYFRLLARDPDALRARTLTDKDIFYNPEGG
jgi:hypothetical protein